MSMDGKVIAVTGGASGIGLATAKLLTSRGAIVCIGDRDISALRSITTTVASESCEVDVTSSSAVNAWIADIVDTHGRLDGAANCAGIIGNIHGICEIADMEDEAWDQIIGVNLTGMMYSLRAELRVISDFGSIVNVSSIQGVMGFAGSGAYSASKHGVIGLTRCAAKEVGDREIRVNAVAPGAILTPLLLKAQEYNPSEGHNNPTAIKRQGTPEEIASIICFLLGPESAYVTGSVYGGDGGWNC